MHRERASSRAGPTRRQFLGVSTTLPLATAAGARIVHESLDDSVARDLQRYISFGNKQSGGPGDSACGQWLEEELRLAGFKTQRQVFSVPCFETEQADLSIDDVRASLWPQPIVNQTAEKGLSAPIVRVDAQGNASRPLANAIALLDLPFGRWSSLFWKQVKAPLDAIFSAGATACVIVTNGPSGKVIALNSDGRKPVYPGPVALLAPDDAAPFFAAAQAGAAATLRLTGSGGRREAFNLVGRLDRGRGNWIVISTPRSGWFTCAGERGGGIAAWLHIARWAAAALPDHDLAFVCNSGHEYQYLGAEELLHSVAPKPAETAFWLHLGANLASRDWHDSVGAMTPLPGTDSQRYLVVSPQLLAAAKAEFAGLAGLEAPYTSDQISAGELTNIIAAGYSKVAGIFGVHRFHHVAGDDETCVSPQAVAETTLAFRNLLARAVA